MLLICHGDLTCQIAYVSHIPFPSGTKGFFYYHQPPALPPLAGELQFRICDDVSQFTYGTDLEIESERLWNGPLTNIVMVGNYKGIWNLLLDEGFVDHELVADIENMKSVGKRARRKTRGGITLYNIDQTFFYQFEQQISLSTSEHTKLHANSRASSLFGRQIGDRHLLSLFRQGNLSSFDS